MWYIRWFPCFRTCERKNPSYAASYQRYHLATHRHRPRCENVLIYLLNYCKYPVCGHQKQFSSVWRVYHVNMEESSVLCVFSLSRWSCVLSRRQGVRGWRREEQTGLELWDYAAHPPGWQVERGESSTRVEMRGADRTGAMRLCCSPSRVTGGERWVCSTRVEMGGADRSGAMRPCCSPSRVTGGERWV
jgi:hypothetical protein